MSDSDEKDADATFDPEYDMGDEEDKRGIKTRIPEKHINNSRIYAV